MAEHLRAPRNFPTVLRGPGADRQITHLICARLKHDQNDFFGGCFWAFYTRKEQEAGPRHPPKKAI